MKKITKILLIVFTSLLAASAVIIPTVFLLTTKKILKDIDNNFTPSNFPTEKIPLPTLNSVKQNYNVSSLNVDVNKAKSYPFQQPITNNTNIYNIELSSNNLNNNYDEISKTLYFNFDPLLSNKNADINVYFNTPSHNTFDYSKVDNIVFYIKKIPEELLINNFMKKFIFNLSLSNHPFLNFSNLKNFIIYEQEQSCFKAPSNYVWLTTSSLPISIKNIYSDASFFRLDSYSNSLIMPDFSSYINLEKLIFDFNSDSYFSDKLMYSTFSWFYSIGSSQFLNTPNIKIYSTFSFDFANYDQLNQFYATNPFGQLNKNYNGFKIPYYLRYINPLCKNKFNFEPSFSVPKDENNDSYKVFLWDKYYKSISNLGYIMTNLEINTELASIVNIKFPWP